MAEKPWFITTADDLDHGREFAMPVIKFAALTAIGAAVWNAMFIAAGWVLADKWHQVDRYSQPIGTGVVIILVAALALLAWRKLRHHVGDAS